MNPEEEKKAPGPSCCDDCQNHSKQDFLQLRRNACRQHRGRAGMSRAELLKDLCVYQFDLINTAGQKL